MYGYKWIKTHRLNFSCQISSIQLGILFTIHSRSHNLYLNIFTYLFNKLIRMTYSGDIFGPNSRICIHFWSVYQNLGTFKYDIFLILGQNPEWNFPNGLFLEWTMCIPRIRFSRIFFLKTFFSNFFSTNTYFPNVPSGAPFASILQSTAAMVGCTIFFCFSCWKGLGKV